MKLFSSNFVFPFDKNSKKFAKNSRSADVEMFHLRVKILLIPAKCRG